MQHNSFYRKVFRCYSNSMEISHHWVPTYSKVIIRNVCTRRRNYAGKLIWHLARSTYATFVKQIWMFLFCFIIQFKHPPNALCVIAFANMSKVFLNWDKFVTFCSGGGGGLAWLCSAISQINVHVSEITQNQSQLLMWHRKQSKTHGN